MESASHAVQATVRDNSISSIKDRMTAGKVSAYWPFLIVLVRPVLAVVSQALVALVSYLSGSSASFEQVGNFWQVYGTLIDLGCLPLLLWLLKREGISLLDLLSFDRSKLGKDILLGLGVFVVGFPLAVGLGSVVASLLVYGSLQPVLPAGLLGKTLPIWAILYSRLIWWPIWSVIEELTYQGYALPRLLALGVRKWVAVAWVGFAWALQHPLLPLYLSWRHVVWMTIMFLPLTVLMQLVRLRVKRLTPLVIAHWAMDFASTWMVF